MIITSFINIHNLTDKIFDSDFADVLVNYVIYKYNQLPKFKIFPSDIFTLFFF